MAATKEKELECVICTMPILVNPFFTPCIHVFHVECLDPWLMQNINNQKIPCPVCKNDISEMVNFRGIQTIDNDDTDDDLPSLDDTANDVTNDEISEPLILARDRPSFSSIHGHLRVGELEASHSNYPIWTQIAREEKLNSLREIPLVDLQIGRAHV